MGGGVLRLGRGKRGGGRVLTVVSLVLIEFFSQKI